MVFASWKPLRVLLGAWLFGGITALQLNTQVAGGLPTGIIELVLIGVVVCLILLQLGNKLAGKAMKLGKTGWGLLAILLVISAACRLMGVNRIAIPVEYLSMAPYLITILVLVIMSSGRGKSAVGAPAALGQNFHASH